MKIIGETKDGFILESNRDEVFNFIGFSYAVERLAPRLKVGDEIQVSELFHQLTSLAHRKRTLEQIAKDLRGLAELIELKQPVIFEGEKKDEG